MIISDEQIEQNKLKFIELITAALSKREGSRTAELIDKLNNSDFFYAPASTRFHNCVKGGLCDHSLNVYFNAMSLAKNKHLIISTNGDTEETEGIIPEESIAIVTLLHDLSKMNYYKLDFRNKKVYCDSGSKHDENGKFDWVSVPGYITIPAEDRFMYGSHEETSEFMVRQFVPLTYIESTAILHHHFALSFDSIKDVGVVGNIYNKYPLAVLLHVADTISAYMDETY